MVVGDTITHNVDLNDVERRTRCRIRSKKAYSSVYDVNARWPQENITDISQKALNNTRSDDPYSLLVLAAPEADISSLDTSKLKEDSLIL